MRIRKQPLLAYGRLVKHSDVKHSASSLPEVVLGRLSKIFFFLLAFSAQLCASRCLPEETGEHRSRRLTALGLAGSPVSALDGEMANLVDASSIKLETEGRLMHAVCKRTGSCKSDTLNVIDEAHGTCADAVLGRIGK